MNARITELLGRGKQILYEEGCLSFLKQVLLFFVYLVNKVLRKIAKKILLIPIVERVLEKVCLFYVMSRREHGFDTIRSQVLRGIAKKFLLTPKVIGGLGNVCEFYVICRHEHRFNTFGTIGTYIGLQVLFY